MIQLKRYKYRPKGQEQPSSDDKDMTIEGELNSNVSKAPDELETGPKPKTKTKTKETNASDKGKAKGKGAKTKGTKKNDNKENEPTDGSYLSGKPGRLKAQLKVAHSIRPSRRKRKQEVVERVVDVEKGVRRVRQLTLARKNGIVSPEKGMSIPKSHYLRVSSHGLWSFTESVPEDMCVQDISLLHDNQEHVLVSSQEIAQAGVIDGQLSMDGQLNMDAQLSDRTTSDGDCEYCPDSQGEVVPDSDYEGRVFYPIMPQEVEAESETETESDSAEEEVDMTVPPSPGTLDYAIMMTW
uniref:ARAD1A07524p n=1 Tax=Blastobotrys adeninivorans TaxID=409370 RepID=A0A060SX92_BLAAD